MSKHKNPFKIEQILSPSIYKLQLSPTWKMHPVFHASLLFTYQETPEHGLNFLSSPPSIIDKEEEYIVESIIVHQGFAFHQQFHLQWKGYSPSEDT